MKYKDIENFDLVRVELRFEFTKKAKKGTDKPVFQPLHDLLQKHGAYFANGREICNTVVESNNLAKEGRILSKFAQFAFNRVMKRSDFAIAVAPEKRTALLEDLSTNEGYGEFFTQFTANVPSIEFE